MGEREEREMEGKREGGREGGREGAVLGNNVHNGEMCNGEPSSTRICVE